MELLGQHVASVLEKGHRFVSIDPYHGQVQLVGFHWLASACLVPHPWATACGWDLWLLRATVATQRLAVSSHAHQQTDFKFSLTEFQL